MTKAEEILEKHLKINDVETMLGRHGATHKAVINALNEAINYTRCDECGLAELNNMQDPLCQDYIEGKVGLCVCNNPKPIMKNSENGISTYCKSCSKAYKQM
jgi:hypothetical protein